MPMAQRRFGGDHEVVVLSDSEDEDGTRHELDFIDAEEILRDFQDPIADFHAQFEANDRELIDLTGIPDVDVPPSDPVVVDDDTPQQDAQANDWGNAEVITEAACLQMILTVLPDISVDYVLKLIQKNTTNVTRTSAQCEHLLTELLEGEPYPKESEEAKNKKRKREDKENDDDDLSNYEKGERDPEIGGYEHDATELLKDEFLTVPVRHIKAVLKEHKTLYKAFGILDQQVRNYGRITSTYSRTGNSRNKRAVETQLIEQGSQLPKELHAAKKRGEKEAVKRRQKQEAEQAEEANLQQAQMNNEMGECACCFGDVPLNRMISCSGDTTHFYCRDCPRQQIETQMGQSRCRPECFGVDDCNGTFSRRQLQEVLSEKTFERLEHMQQQEDLEAAGLDFLSECPFCDFKMECPPVEVDKEFRCQSSKCGKTSCRLCEKESHVPLSCEEFKKDGKITLRHIVEEAMSAALIRHCNQCKHPFIKELGCNKMTCTHCRNVQCYVCSKNVTDYNHFGEAMRGKCPLHENIEDRHEQEVKRAADEAMTKVRADNPGLSDADLMVKVSDRVKNAEDARKGRAGTEARNFPYQMVGEQLRLIVPPPPPPGRPAFGARGGVPPPPPPSPPPGFPQAAQYVQPYPAFVPPVFYGYGAPPMPIFPPIPPVYPFQPIDYYGHAPPQPPDQPRHRPFDALLNLLHPGAGPRPLPRLGQAPAIHPPPAERPIPGLGNHQHPDVPRGGLGNRRDFEMRIRDAQEQARQQVDLEQQRAHIRRMEALLQQRREALARRHEERANDEHQVDELLRRMRAGRPAPRLDRR